MINKSIYKLLFYLIIITFFACSKHKDSPQKHDTLNPLEIKYIKEGDIILRKGFGLVSNVIVNTLKEKYKISHCGLIVKKSNNFYVIHSVSKSISKYDGVQEEKLNTFINDCMPNSLIIVRPRTNTNDIKMAISKAKYFLNKKIPFDNAFDSKDSSAFFCQELIYRAFNLNFSNTLNFAPFLDTAKFRIIINHQSIKSI
jgi:hypothetical protein